MSREILMLVDALAREKNVSKDIVFSALETALASATRKRIHDEADLLVTIDRETGDYDSVRRWTVVLDDEMEEPQREIALSQAQADNPEAQLGDIIEEQIEPAEFGRIGAQAAKQVILQRIRDAEKEQILNDFLARGESMVSGTAKRLDRGNLIIECGRVEAILPKDQMIPKENIRIGDRVKAFLLRVDNSGRGPQLILSRTAPEFLVSLFQLEVPEIEEGLLDVISAARDPGVRAKIAVKAKDQRIDPVGTCVGIRGSRVGAVSNELCGERVDIVVWSDEPAQYVINALQPAEVSSIMIDEDRGAMEVVVDEDNLAIAIGRSGQNVRLASELTGWIINLMTPEESDQKNEEEHQRLQDQFMTALSIDSSVADILIQEGFATVEEVAYVPINEMTEIEDFDEELVNELRTRARNFLLTKAMVIQEQVEQVSKDMLDLEGMNMELASTLAQHNILTRDDLADLSTDDLMEMTEMNEEDAKALIIKAREHWFI